MAPDGGEDVHVPDAGLHVGDFNFGVFWSDGMSWWQLVGELLYVRVVKMDIVGVVRTGNTNPSCPGERAFWL